MLVTQKEKYCCANDGERGKVREEQGSVTQVGKHPLKVKTKKKNRKERLQLCK